MLKKGQLVAHGRTRYRVDFADILDPGNSEKDRYYFLEALDGSGQRLLPRRELALVCKNCKQHHYDHTRQGKCLYGPGNWEE